MNCNYSLNSTPRFFAHALFVLYLSVFSTQQCYADEDINQEIFAHFAGEALVQETEIRKLEVKISKLDNGFNISWNTIKINTNNKSKKSYSINFQKTQRPGIYAAGMKANLFGGTQQLDPMKGEPYFWATASYDSITVYGLVITDTGGYEIQRYHRQLKQGNLQVEYKLYQQDELIKSIQATLIRQ